MVGPNKSGEKSFDIKIVPPSPANKLFYDQTFDHNCTHIHDDGDPENIHSKSEYRDPNDPAKKLNFPQIYPKMPQNDPKMAKNDPKWPKYDPKWPKNYPK